MSSAMKIETKQNLWQIVKYLLTLGVSAIVNAIQRRRSKKQSFTPEQLERSKRLQKAMEKINNIDVEPLSEPFKNEEKS